MEPSEVAELQHRAAFGDAHARERLIRSHRKFILWAANRSCRRHIDPERDDEWSVALIAFNEAIDTFREGGGAGFLSHARLVIGRRLVDYFRQNGKQEWLPLDEALEDEEGRQQRCWAEEQAAWDRYRRDTEVAERAEEIGRYASDLAGFGLDMDDLEQACPTHRDTRLELLRIAAALAAEPRLMGFLRARRQLPIRELMASTGASRKILETWRRYIIAVAVILGGDYDHLREFVRLPSSEGGR